MRIIKIIILLFIFFSVSTVISSLIPKVDYCDKIAVIPVKGSIAYDQGYTGADAGQILEYLETAEKEQTVKAVLLEINSGGGAVVASKQIADKIKAMKKPVVSVIYEVGASGAYWIASGSDKIIADPLSVTGAVGVLGSYIEWAGLMENYNVTYQKLVGGELKDLGTPFRKSTDFEKEIMQKKINMIHEYFLNSVKENRNLTSLSGINTGVYYLGGEAKVLGLVDYLGGRELAVKVANQLAGTKDAKLVEFKQKTSLFGILNKLSSDIGFNVGKGISGSYIENEFKVLA